MSSLNQNARILLIVGIVLIILCAIGMAVQWQAYSEYAESGRVKVQGGPANGANGSFARAISAWSGSPQAKAEHALGSFIFMTIGCGIGCLFVYLALRRRPQPVQPEPEPEERPEPRTRRPNSPSYWQ